MATRTAMNCHLLRTEPVLDARGLTRSPGPAPLVIPVPLISPVPLTAPLPFVRPVTPADPRPLMNPCELVFAEAGTTGTVLRCCSDLSSGSAGSGEGSAFKTAGGNTSRFAGTMMGGGDVTTNGTGLDSPTSVFFSSSLPFNGTPHLGHAETPESISSPQKGHVLFTSGRGVVGMPSLRKALIDSLLLTTAFSAVVASLTGVPHKGHRVWPSGMIVPHSAQCTVLESSRFSTPQVILMVQCCRIASRGIDWQHAYQSLLLPRHLYIYCHTNSLD